MKVKICGLTNWKDAEAAITYGADLLGFVFEPSSPRFVETLSFLQSIPNTIETVAVFGELPKSMPEDALHLNAVQWVSGVLNEESPSKRIKALRMGGTLDAESLEVCAPFDWLVLDSYHPTLMGGSGTAVDWEDAALIVRYLSVRHPVLLAGGLTPENVAKAINIVQPFGVDVSGGVESSPGHKDPIKIRDFIQAAKA